MTGQYRVGWMIHRMELLIRYRLRLEDGALIPPVQMRMLEYIERYEGCTQAELADHMRVTPASIAQSVKRMENTGYVTRAAVSGNLRANSLRITDNGKRAAANCRCVFDQLERDILMNFTESERTVLYELLERLMRNLESKDTDQMNNMELKKMLEGGKEKPHD
ncbi:MAG: winged helix-turn-helix transcriptional regulator [Oscillospiraceae bacterium]|nr:winged helix-turn-helix transcriptional regulator [Oscillospiraceae bacterium]